MLSKVVFHRTSYLTQEWQIKTAKQPEASWLYRGEFNQLRQTDRKFR